ncbi:hypothetical protein QBC43DRAFT_316293 [Cladorrhinum sp. PSN259]|nr:hypothetical protein QBC43DRAFT_316293 [Cladorrhinum sp. PSN259]
MFIHNTYVVVANILLRLITIAMALINPVHGLVVPFLCIFTIPLAIFAGITSALAFSVLMLRVAAVYLDIALALVPQYFKGKSQQGLPSGGKHRRSRSDGWKTPSSPPGSAGSYSGYSTPSPITRFPETTGYLNSGYISPAHHHRRKSSYGFGFALSQKHRRSSSQVSTGSVGTITPIHEGEVSNDITPAAPSIGLDRDFEGIGGWRLDDGNDDGADWANINSRLELPLERSPFSRHSQRSQSVGPFIPSEGSWLLMRNSRRESGVVEDFQRESRDTGFSLGTSLGTSKGSSPNSSRVRLNHTIALPPPFTPVDSEIGSWVPVDRLTPRSPKKISFS